MADLTAELRKKHPEKEFEVLDPVTFFRLLKVYLNSSGSAETNPK
jgi:hypothetical protein